MDKSVEPVNEPVGSQGYVFDPSMNMPAYVSKDIEFYKFSKSLQITPLETLKKTNNYFSILIQPRVPLSH